MAHFPSLGKGVEPPHPFAVSMTVSTRQCRDSLYPGPPATLHPSGEKSADLDSYSLLPEVPPGRGAAWVVEI
jgi:hypothetical protein